jgi:hypothetical protein
MGIKRTTGNTFFFFNHVVNARFAKLASGCLQFTVGSEQGQGAKIISVPPRCNDRYLNFIAIATDARIRRQICDIDEIARSHQKTPQ